MRPPSSKTARPPRKEHFGYTDGFGNPDYLGVGRNTQPGQGKLMPDGKPGTRSLPVNCCSVMPMKPASCRSRPCLTSSPPMEPSWSIARCTRTSPPSAHISIKWALASQATSPKRKTRLQIHRPLERWNAHRALARPTGPTIVQDPNRNTDFKYGKDDLEGTRCPIGAHIRRVHPRDAFGFKGRLIDRRRITRRGLPYGPTLP